MIKLKTDKDIELIEKAIKIGQNTLSYVRKIIFVGMTTKQLDNRIEKFILDNHAKSSFKGYRNFPNSSCISINEEVIHGIPSNRKIKEGDIVKVDVGINFENRYSDQAITILMDNYKDIKDLKLVYATKLALERAKEVAIVNNTINDISYEIQRTAKKYNLGIVNAYCGHGVGLNVHEEPNIPNIVDKKNNIKFVKGMVIAIEPIFTLGSGQVQNKGYTVITQDNSIASHFEETIIIK